MTNKQLEAVAKAFKLGKTIGALQDKIDHCFDPERQMMLLSQSMHFEKEYDDLRDSMESSTPPKVTKEMRDGLWYVLWNNSDKDTADIVTLVLEYFGYDLTDIKE